MRGGRVDLQWSTDNGVSQIHAHNRFKTMKQPFVTTWTRPL